MIRTLWALIGKAVYYTLGIIALPVFLNGTKRVKVAIIDPNANQILLCRTWISSQVWNLVGGGIKRNEDKFEAARREVKEETGLDVDVAELEYIAEVNESEFMANFSSHIFMLHIAKKKVAKPRFELIDLQWHKLDKLPKPYNNQTINRHNIKQL